MFRMLCLVGALCVSSASSVLAAPGDVVWSVPVQGEVWGCPAVGPDGVTLWVGTYKGGARIYRIDGATGTILDSAWARGLVENGVALSHDGRLYVPTLPTATPPPGFPGVPAPGIECFDATTLTALWVTRTDHTGSDNSPVLGHPQRPNRVYLGQVADPRAPAGFSCPSRFFNGFDATTGERVLALPIEGWQASPGVVTPAGHIFFGAEDLRAVCDSGATPSAVLPGAFHALTGSDDGSALWPTFYSAGEFGGALAWDAGVVWATCRDGYLRGFREEDGAIVFERDLGARAWSGVTIGLHPVSGRRILYVGTQSEDLGDPGGASTFYAIEDDGTPAGAVLWSRVLGAGFAWGNACMDDQNNVYCTTSAGVLHAFTWDGVPLWTRALPGAGQVTPLGGVDGPTLLDNGILVTGSSGGYVLGIQSNGNHLNDRVPWPKYKHDLRNTSNPLTPIRDSNPPLAVGEPQPGAGVELAPPAPNPVLRSARISLALARATRVTLAVHDLAGRRVRTLASGTLAAGIHQCLWDRTDDGGRAVPPGVYRVRASAGALVRSRSIVVL